MASGTKLMDEIYDQFLLCKICYETYKRPKTLSCLHTFCEICLEKHQDAEIERSYRYMMYSRAVTCPICRKKTEMPSGGIKRLPDNFLVASLNDVVSRRKPLIEAPLCEICQSADGNYGKTAVSKCLECSKLLCKGCGDLHRRTKVTQNHTLFDTEVEKDIECKIHKDEVVRFYCELCEMCICVVCTFQEHKGHDVSSFTDGMLKYKNSLDSLVGSCRERIGHIKEYLELIAKCETEVKKAEDQIRDTTIETIGAIRKKEKDMIERLYSIYGTETFEYFKEKMPMQETLESLQTTCNLTDIITKDQNIELLLLKKDIQEKLKLLLQQKLMSPPGGIDQQVRFTPGHLVFGALVTDERRPPGLEDFQMVDEKGNVMDIDVQTDRLSTSDQWTTMGQFLRNYSNEQLTQTDKICAASRGSSPMAIPSSHQGTMTISTPVTKRKIQTDHVETYRDNAKRKTTTSNKCTGTMETIDESIKAVSKRLKVSDQDTDTVGLFNVCNKETGTQRIENSHRGTSTETISTLSKSTLTLNIKQADKDTATVPLVQNTQSTMTPAVRTLDMGIGCKIPGENKAVGTKTIVLTHASSGNFDVRTSDKSIETSTPVSPTTRDCDNMKDQTTFTDNFNKLDKITCTTRVFTSTVGTVTPSSQQRHKGIGTLKIDMIHQSIEADLGYPKPVMSTMCSQTALSFREDVMIPNLVPCDKCVSTERVEYRERATATPKLKHKHKHVLTESAQMKDSSSETILSTATQETQAGSDSIDNKSSSQVQTKDSSHDCYRGIVHETSTNTDFDDVSKSQKSAHKVASITIPERKEDVKFHTKDGETSMSSVVQTADAFCSVVPEMKEVSSATEMEVSGLKVTDMPDSAPATHKVDSVCQATETVRTSTSDVSTEMMATEFVHSGNDAVFFIGTDQSTDPIFLMGDDKATVTSSAQLADIGVGTPTVSAQMKETSTDVVQTRDAESATFIDTKETATHTPQPKTTMVGTCTTPVTMSDKTSNTPSVKNTHISTMTHVPKFSSVETSMLSNVIAEDRAVCTDRIELIHMGVDARKIEICNTGTGMPKITYCESSTSTVPVSASTVSTTTLHSVVTSEQSVGTPAVVTSDASSTADILKPYVGQSISTMTAPVQTAEVGILKRPHTVTRGTEAVKLRRVSRGTAPSVPYTRDTSSMTQPMETEDKAISVMTVKQITRSTGTPKQKLVSSSTSMTQAAYTDRESSPIRTVLVDRASSPIPMDTCDRESSPVRFPVHDKRVGVKADTKETYTSTARVKFRSRGTMYEPAFKTVNRESSPVEEIQPVPPETVEKATAMTQVVLTDREVSPIRGFTKERGTATNVVKMVDRESPAIPIPTKTQGVSAIAKMTTKGVCTPHITKKECSTSMPVVETTETATAMPFVSFLEKETSTPQIHTMHRNISTESIVTAEKHTSMDAEVSAAYKETIKEAQPVTVSRGTCTPSVTMIAKETSPPRFGSLKDRASSPFRILRMVDKAVSARRGEILAPMDKFQKVGLQKQPLKPIAEGPRQTLASIQEDLTEAASDEDCGTPEGCSTSKATITSPPVSTASVNLQSVQSSFTHRETFQTSLPRLGKSIYSTFNSQAGGRGTPASILWKVETATNTPEIYLETKGTSTPPVEKEDKAICTESITMEGKMADCISKLKNVRQRLEQQPLYSQAPMPTQVSVPSKASTASSQHGTLEPIFTNTKSRSVGDRINEGGLGLPPTAPSFLRRGTVGSTDSLATGSEGSEEDISHHTRGSRRLGLARKQRLDISELLRSSSVPENAYPPYERPKLQVQAVHAHVIPKLNVDDFKAPKPTKDKKAADGNGSNGSPLVKTKRSKHRARPRETQNLTDAISELRRNSDSGEAIRSRQDRQKDRFEKLVPLRRLPSVPQSGTESPPARSSPRVRRKPKDAGETKVAKDE